MTAPAKILSAGERRFFGAIALAGFASAIVGFAPASLAAWAIRSAAPMTAVAGAEGSLWNGRLGGVSYNGVLLGDVDYELSAASLLLGRASIDATSANGALEGSARIILTPGAAEFRRVSAAFNLGAIRNYTFFGVRYQGEARLKAARLKIKRGGCEADDAKISTTAFDALSRQLSGGAFPMDGAVDCRDGALIATLSGAGTDGAADISVTVRPDLTYSLAVAARPQRQDLSRALQLFGFESKGDGLAYEAAGVLKGLNS